MILNSLDFRRICVTYLDVDINNIDINIVIWYHIIDNIPSLKGTDITMQKTEMRNPLTTHIDKMSTSEMLQVIQNENRNAVEAVGEALEDIGKAVDAISASLEKGGRLIYMGAGTSGRLGVIDAAECPPTYGVSYDTVIGIIAGGKEAMFRANEGGEDDPMAGVADLKEKELKSCDTVVGISAAGNAAYVIHALEYAKSIGCTTVGISSNHGCLLEKTADIAIITDTGAEVITGSTRMKAGTAQKLVLNMLSTCAMVKTGKVYENLMINLRPTNIKLARRMISIVSEIMECDEEKAEKLLNENDWNIRKAVGEKE